MQDGGFLHGEECLMLRGLVDSMVVMHYDNTHQKAIEWWESMLENGWEIHISQVTLMERLKGIPGLPGSREETLNLFRFRIQQMRKERIISRIWPITRDISKIAHSLLERYCLRFTPPTGRGRMEALICDMLIAATALKHGLVLFTRNMGDFEWINDLQVERADYEIEEGDETS